ncbi:MAG: carbohydrate porin [Aquabacterium sp.]|nr:carbohydrate porin [Aquabacterium sp.]
MRRTAMASALAAALAGPALAADDAVMAELKRLAARVEALEQQNQELKKALASERLSEKDPEIVSRIKYVETQVDAIKGPATKLADALDGVSVEGSLVAIAQRAGAGATSSGTRESRINYRGDVGVTLPAGSMGDQEGTLYTQVRMGQGNGVGLRPTYSSTPNTGAFEKAEGADDSFAILAQAWYQLKVPLSNSARKEDAREHLYLTVGKIDPFVFFDQNAAADDESAKFLNNVFVHNPLLDSGGDIGADAYGFQPGAVLRYENSRQKGGEWALSLGLFASDAGANFSGSSRTSFVIGQAEMNTRWNYLPGAVRAYAWRNARAASYDGAQRAHAGWGISADQKVTEALTLFGRFGHHASGLVRFDRAITLGAELEGTPWRRSADSLGVAFGQLRTSRGFRRDSATVDGDGDGLPDHGYMAAGSERQAELYYRFKLNDAVELTPNLQWIGRPGGDASAPAVKLVGLRATLGF